MNQQSGSPFDSIENAHAFVGLLSEVVAETKRDIDADIQRELSAKSSRRLDALRIAFYSLEKLELHMTTSCRILNDLRSLRRLLFEERSSGVRIVPPKALATVAEPLAAVAASLSLQVTDSGAQPERVMAA
jgi:hypothetical protein